MRNATRDFERMTPAACLMIGLGLGLQAASWDRAQGWDHGKQPDLVAVQASSIYAEVCRALTPARGTSVLDIDVDADERYPSLRVGMHEGYR